MKITAITKYKDGALWGVLSRAGWTIIELSRRTNVNQTTLSAIINLRRRPTQKQADAIQRAFGEIDVYIDVLENWPETFKGFNRPACTEMTQDVPDEHLLAYCNPLLLTAPQQPDEIAIAEEDALERDTLLNEFVNANAPYSPTTVRDVKIIEDRLDGMVAEDIGKKHGVSGCRVSQIIKSTLVRIARHVNLVRNLNSTDRDLKDLNRLFAVAYPEEAGSVKALIEKLELVEKPVHRDAAY